MTLFADDIRDPDTLALSGLGVIGQAMEAGAKSLLPLFSGGHDSLCACHLASRHPAFDGRVHHIDTGIGAKATRRFVDDVCKEYGWKIEVYKSKETYEKFVRQRGFPGPGRHHWVYARIKDRCVRQMVKKERAALITGCRKFESVRRMGTVEPIKIGEQVKRGTVNRRRVWTAPCHDWTTVEQAAYMAEHDLPRNPVKIALGMSGECFCGAFASPGELNRIRAYAPDVAIEIDRLTDVARSCGTHAEWGTRPAGDGGLTAVQSGPLCSTCDRRAYAAGLLFDSAK